MTSWEIFTGDGQARPANIWQRSAPPPWRTFAASGDGPGQDDAPRDEDSRRLQGSRYRLQQADAVDRVNAALHLRRPILVTGPPGVGKSTLAYALAHELGLGRVLRWPITSRSKLQEGLYAYDAVGRMQDIQVKRRRRPIGHYITLGPLGTALLPRWRTPRVLLIDEVDKCDVDLPNDLLNVFEDGEYLIGELIRDAEPLIQPATAGAANEYEVRTADGERVKLESGSVSCREFPIVVMTSNSEREFPPAFNRRCQRLSLEQPDLPDLERIVAARLDPGAVSEGADLINKFGRHDDKESLATDQLLNAIFLLRQVTDIPDAGKLATLLFQPLDGAAGTG